MSAASALCLIWAAGCASTSEPASKTTAASSSASTASTTLDSNADVATLTKTLPATLDGEIQRAHMLREKGDYDEAARSFAQLLLVAPDDARVVGGYGKVLAQQGHSKEALGFLKRAVELDPHDWSLQSALGIAYDQSDDHARARAAYEHALALKPGDASVLNNYAVSRMLAGDYTAAKRLFAQAEAKGVSNPKIALNLEKLTSLNNVPAAVTANAPKTAPDAKSQEPTETTMKNGAVTVANLAAPSAQSATQPLSAKLPPIPAVTATATTTRKTASSANSTRTAVAAPKALTTAVVMQKVPVDPLAGPAKRRDHATQKLAATPHQTAKAAASATSVAAAPATPPPPALRTAADGD
ncbi:MAG TPA: tetratricopeptide repeat protein [Rhizomicrobium sp.]|nr:tetratricopeptide repeat protein [Rhizomicrobium sp.]